MRGLVVLVLLQAWFVNSRMVAKIDAAQVQLGELPYLVLGSQWRFMGPNK
jgi:hypothetical protein